MQAQEVLEVQEGLVVRAVQEVLGAVVVEVLQEEAVEEEDIQVIILVTHQLKVTLLHMLIQV
jgi:hypothetical protein